jgi:hypothetical protein
MTRQEFQRSQTIGRNLAAVLMFVPFALLGLAALYHPEGFFAQDGQVNTLGVVLLVSVSLMFLSSLSVAARVRRRYLAACPKCRQTLSGIPRTIVLSTGRCGNCGHQILTNAR